MKEHRATYLRFLQFHTEVCGVLKLHGESFEKVSYKQALSLTRQLKAVLPLCDTVRDRLRIGTLVMRQLVSGGSGRHFRVDG
jgi:hypothetical protein